MLPPNALLSEYLMLWEGHIIQVGVCLTVNAFQSGYPMPQGDMFRAAGGGVKC